MILSLEMLVYPAARPPEMWLVYLFGYASGLVAILLYLARQRFLKQSRARQSLWAGAIWTVHVAVFVVLALLY